jgi:beta-glucosidase
MLLLGFHLQPTAGGKSPSIWDHWSQDTSHMKDGKGPAMGTNHYEKWQEDIALMKSYGQSISFLNETRVVVDRFRPVLLGVNSYRMSLAWPRIVPSGKKGGKVNKQGVTFYRDLILALNKANITPFVTLYHWDLPQSLLEEYGGWIDRKIIDDFEVGRPLDSQTLSFRALMISLSFSALMQYYARVCFENFGELVENWFTINEPNIHAMHGYRTGEMAPGRTSDQRKSPVGDSSVEHLIAGHHLLLAHATVAKLYRAEFKQGNPDRKISLVVNVNWGEPMTDSPEDKYAAEKFVHCNGLWMTDPVVFGDYPDHLKETAGDKLPVFTEDEKKLLKGSTDCLT